MSDRNDAPADVADRQLVVVRDLPFPRELVFEAWTDPRHVAEWWGPNGFTNTVEHFDFRPGGAWRYTMHGPDGVDWPNLVQYTEILPGRRLAYDHGDGTPGSSHWFRVVVDFADAALAEGPGTRLTLQLTFDTVEACEASKAHGAVEGGRQTLARFAQHLRERVDGTAVATEEVFVITRDFAAPRALVWQAWTDPAHLLQWFGPVGMQITNKAFELKPGGRSLSTMRSPDGSEMHGLWIFREIVPPVLLSFEQAFADAEGRPVPPPFPGAWPSSWITSVRLTEHDGKTRLVLRSTPVAASAAQRRFFRDMHGSMTQGWGGTLAALATFLAGR